MKVKQLTPTPEHVTQFERSHQVTVPDTTGCYVLATYRDDVLYVGLAKNLRSRMGNHLDTPAKLRGGPDGVPFWFCYLLCSADRVNAIEQGWMNQSFLEDGKLPHLNRVQSPL